jgi:hypothetical protein
MCGSCFFSTPRMLAAAARLFVFGVLHLLAQVLDGADQEAAGAGGRVEHLSPSCGLTMSTMNWVTARGV